MRQPPCPVTRPPKRPASTQFTELTTETRRGIESSHISLATLRAKIRTGGSFDHEEWEINDLIRTLQVELSAVDQRIRDLDHFLKSGSSAPRNAPFILQALREGLSAIGGEFRTAVQERAAKLEEYHRRRRHICARRFEQPPEAVFHEDAGAPREALMLLNRDRMEQVRSVEGSVAQVAQMFTQLNELIEAQHYDVVRIDEDVDAALSHVGTAQKELERYYEKLKGNRCLIFKIMGILIAFAFLFILVI
jgi:DNA repair exonuclease SbcCD ATPase subunit